MLSYIRKAIVASHADLLRLGEECVTRLRTPAWEAIEKLLAIGPSYTAGSTYHQEIKSQSHPCYKFLPHFSFYRCVVWVQLDLPVG